MSKRILHLAGLAFWMASAVAIADDKDLLKKGAAPANMMIVFGNSQTTEQPILGSTSAFDGDGDSPASKMGAAKRVIQQFISARHTTFNIGMTTFSHNPNAGSITISGKHWLYSPLTVDFPSESWKEPISTIERWGLKGEGPCTNLTVPICTDRSPNINLTGGGIEAGSIFFGSLGTGTAYICLDGTKCNDGKNDNATKRLRVTLTAGKYGDAYTTGALSAYTLADHSMEVTKVYQVRSPGNNGTWGIPASLHTLNGDPATVTVSYKPSSTLTADLFYTTGADAGKEIGFLNDPQNNIDVNANCSGWEFQTGSAPQPLIKIPRDYCSTSITSVRKCNDDPTSACSAPQDSLPCANRLLRPQAKLVAYNQTTGAFTTTDPDNPGYTGVGSKYADGCDSTLLGAVDAGLDITENQAIMITRNGSQAPIKNLLVNIYEYFSKPSIDGFSNGKRSDDPNKACRVSGVVLIYDNFNGCTNDSCSFLTDHVLKSLKQINVKVYVIGLGASANSTSGTGVCIAQNTGAVLPDGTPGYFPVTNAAGLLQALIDISDLLDESSQVFATAAVSTGQAQGDQMAYFASFSAVKNRSIWNGRLGGYKLDANGNVQTGLFTITDPNDPNVGSTIPVPSNDPASLIWNAGANLIQTTGTGATVSSAVLAPGSTLSGSGSYLDDSNDIVTTIPTRFYSGRKIVFSLPKTIPSPLTNLPIPAANAVPENRYDLIFNTGASWWPTLKALLGPQTSPPAASPLTDDTDAGNSLRFIWGDRDAVTGATDLSRKYLGQKLGDIFHSSPLLVGGPNDFFLFKTNAEGGAFCSINTAKACTIGGSECTGSDGVCQILRGYKNFSDTYHTRRRVMYVSANDGLLHAFDAGAFDRNQSICDKKADGSAGDCYDLGTGAELFAFAPRSIMQIYKPLKDAVGAQNKLDEWTVDLSPSAADAFIDAGHSGTPDPTHRAWHTVLVGGVREGSPFEGTSGAAPRHSQGSYYALDITQPDELVVSGSGVVGPPSTPYTTAAPKCLNLPTDTPPGDSSCGKDAADATVRTSQPARAWPTVLWEITDTCDQDVSGSPGFGYPDMGETWAKASMGRIRICTANCDSTSPLPTFEDHFVTIFGGGFDRERKNRRGNWLYIVDIETGKALYKVNSDCGGDPLIGGCTPTYFGSIPSEPAALDYNDDGYLDLIYVGDLKGQLWRIDLTDLRLSSPPVASTCDPSNRFRNQLDLVNGSGKPFLLFQAPQPAPATTPIYPIYFRPEAIVLGYNSGGRPALGISFGTGDRDDILGTVDSSNLTSKQRYYYIIDAANNTPTFESTSGMLDITTPTALPTPSAPGKGWFLEFVAGERVVGDSLVLAGIIRFPTFNPISSTPGTDACANAGKCSSSAGTSRLYQVDYKTGNAYLGASDRGQTQTAAMFITAETSYLSGGTDAHGIFWSGGVSNPPLGVGKKITVRSWKEKSSQP